MAVLVTGGAGYIGSAFVEQLLAAGGDVVVLDDLSRGHRGAVDPDATFYEGRTGDRALVARIAREHGVDACVHFAALAYVGESVTEPARYYDNNFTQAQVLCEALLEAGVKRIVFSSTCATYGVPQEIPIPETHPQQPINPYGWSKLFVERMLEDFDRAYGLGFVALRYFNAAGATARRGEDHDPETHLIPLALAAAAGRRPRLAVFGTDYPTPDGTAIRDYIHIEDLGEAHLLALRHLREGGDSEYLNLGNGTGYSVLEVIEATRKVTGLDVPFENAPRREGDPARLVGDARRAREILGWEPKRPALEDIIRSAWEWQNAHPRGYEG
ncbi:MAG: UDP-glucose 4-epimerase GalE [Acidobacteria bacterium]|jgi:UDP-glucose 4-epimerase|nr:UDP-glucose 4-epimerase GalE [Acidobacteriota bacterium]